MGRGEAQGRPTHLESRREGARGRQDDGQVECRRREHLRGKARVCKSCSRAHTEWVMSRELQTAGEARALLSDLRSSLASACALVVHLAARQMHRSGERASGASAGRVVWWAISAERLPGEHQARTAVELRDARRPPLQQDGRHERDGEDDLESGTARRAKCFTKLEFPAPGRISSRRALKKMRME